MPYYKYEAIVGPVKQENEYIEYVFQAPNQLAANEIAHKRSQLLGDKFGSCIWKKCEQITPPHLRCRVRWSARTRAWVRDSWEWFWERLTPGLILCVVGLVLLAPAIAIYLALSCLILVVGCILAIPMTWGSAWLVACWRGCHTREVIDEWKRPEPFSEEQKLYQ